MNIKRGLKDYTQDVLIIKFMSNYWYSISMKV